MAAASSFQWPGGGWTMTSHTEEALAATDLMLI